MSKIDEINNHIKILSDLENERQPYFDHWKELSERLLPTSGKFLNKEKEKGALKYNKIYNNVAFRAIRTLVSGFSTYMTNPSKPWMRHTIQGKGINQSFAVRTFLEDSAKLMLSIFAQSNVYGVLQTTYNDLVVFGTGAFIVMDDFQDVIRLYPLEIGEYCLGKNSRNEIDRMYRKFDMSVYELVDQFGIEKCSETVQNFYKNKRYTEMVTVVHTISPRKNYDSTKADNLNMPFQSCYFELGAHNGVYLKESGFKRFPVIAPRWGVRANDIYGYSPGMECLGDVKALQHEELRKAQGIDYQTMPTLQIPTNLKGTAIDALPGGNIFVDMSTPSQSVKTAFEVPIQLQYLMQDIAQVEQRINKTFYYDIFMMMSSMEGSPLKAAEVYARQEERLFVLGDVVQRFNHELLKPLIDIVFDRMIDAGLLTDIPEELSGQQIEIEFVSVLAQAQKAITTNATDRFVQTMGGIAGFDPGVLDRFNTDAWVDDYSDSLGINPHILRSIEEAGKLRQARQQAQQQQMQTEQLKQQASAAKDLSAANTSGDNALSDVINMFSGYGS